MLSGGLVYVSDADPGIGRRRSGKAFRYFDHSGRPIEDQAELDRIRQLAVPPAYNDVWICPKANGHIQATGLDAAGRKQYRYHPEWSNFRGQAKFDRLPDFARQLPKIRRNVTALLDDRKAAKGFDKDVAIAALVRLLDHTAMRIGGRSRASHGATTLQMRHVSYGNNNVRLRYVAKGGKKAQSTISDKKLQRILEKIDDLPGKRLFQYVGIDGSVHPLDSSDVNNWLKAITGIDEVSAKMFRTWHGSVAALEALRAAEQPSIKVACEAAAEILCNTPAIARKSYVHPDILKLVETAGDPRRIAAAAGPRGLTAAERRFLGMVG